MTNCRIVRPLEIRAKKSPTKGDHATHQAQKKSVQLFIQSVGLSNAKLFNVMPKKRLV